MIRAVRSWHSASRISFIRTEGYVLRLREYCVFCKVPWNMADAGKIFLNDNLLPLAYMHTEGQQIIQLWHGAGAFKRFGLSTEEDPNVRKQVAEANKHVTHLFVTSTQIIPYYSEAFAIPTDRIYATGIPVLDAYF